MTHETYTRKLSYNERMFIAADDICPPVVNQLFLEGEGFFNIEKWRNAVEVASAANPGSRLILKGHLGMSRWIDSGITPEVIEVDGSGWDGTGPAGAPFLSKRLFPRKGPTCEVLLIHGSPLRVCFRTHHAVMDGRGTLLWAEDIFRVLRSDDPEGFTSRITDFELVRSVNKKYRTPFPRDSIAPTGTAGHPAKGVTWKRITIPGSYKNILGQVMVISAIEAWKYRQGPVRFSVPVDLRPLDRTVRSTGNLAIAIYVEVTGKSTSESISLDIKNQLQNKHECMIDRLDPYICNAPLRLLTHAGRCRINSGTRSGKYGISGILSNMGFIPSDVFKNVYSGGGFNSSAFWGIPPSFENVPYFMGITSRENKLEIILTLPEVLADNGRLDNMLETIRNGLKPE